MRRQLWTIKAGLYRSVRSLPGLAGILESENRAVRNLLEQIPGDSTWRVLDAGTGRGNGLSLLKSEFDHLYAMDFSRRMLRKTHPGYPDTNYAVADVGSMPHRDSVFDLVTCIGVAEYVPDFAALLSEIH